MKAICRSDTGNDFIILEVLGVEQISMDKKYPGVKTKFLGHILNVRIPFSIDVGIDDVIVPEPVRRRIITRLPDFEPPIVFTYSLESTIAEKFDAILQRMAGTSRMKDFYDIYYLSGIFDFDGGVLLNAVKSTLIHRNREMPVEVFEDIAAFSDDEFLITQWKAFEPAKNAGLSFRDAIDRLKIFIEPIYSSILHGNDFSKKWKCERKMWV